MNLYRGCTHGCIYCDSRSRCYGMTHAFTDVEVKRNAPALLETALLRRKARSMIGTGAMSDPYQPLEERFLLTRRCLTLLEQYGFGASIQTKSDRILRDADLIEAINLRARAVVQMTVTTYDEALCKLIEPNVCGTQARFETLNAFHERGIPIVVWITPLLPFLNDTEENLLALLNGCFAVGVSGILSFGMGVTLREGDREYFYDCLDRDFPGLRKRYEQSFGDAYECPSPNQARLNQIFVEQCEAHGVLYKTDEVFAFLHDFPKNKKTEQLSLF